jgi:hypothetical protein
MIISPLRANVGFMCVVTHTGEFPRRINIPTVNFLRGGHMNTANQESMLIASVSAGLLMLMVICSWLI